MKRFTLLDGETVILEDTIHFKNYIIPASLLSVCTFSVIFRAFFTRVSLVNRVLGTTLVPAHIQPWLSLAEIGILTFLSGLSIISMLRTSMIRYYITDKRVVAVSGLIETNYQEMMLSRIETVILHQNIYERMYACGDVLCVAPGSQVFLDDVRDAVRFKQTLLGLISDRENTKTEKNKD